MTALTPVRPDPVQPMPTDLSRRNHVGWRTGLAVCGWAGCHTGHRRPGGARLTLRSEVGAKSPRWKTNGEMVPLADFPPDPRLREELENWTATAWEHDNARVREEVKRLRGELARQLGAGYEVVDDDSP